MTAEFEVGKTIHDGVFYDALNTSLDDLPFYMDLARQAKGTVLELCCGTGRLTIPIAEAGIQITGLDLTPSMLTRARDKSDGLGIDWVESDIREFSLDRRFDLILLPFNSLQHIYSIDDLERVFANVQAHLNEGGIFAFDVFHPNIELMVERSRRDFPVGSFTLDDGTDVSITERCEYDSAAQVNRVCWTYRIGGREIVERLDMRCFFPLEMGVLLRSAGFAVSAKFGGFAQEPFASGSSKQIYICRRA